MTRYIVTNDINNTAVVFFDINKARATVDYLTVNTRYLWYMKIVSGK